MQYSIEIVETIFCLVLLLLNWNIFMLACGPSWQYIIEKQKEEQKWVKIKVANKSGYFIRFLFSGAEEKLETHLYQWIVSTNWVSVTMVQYLYYINYLHRSCTINIVNISNMIHVIVNSQSRNCLKSLNDIVVIM